MEASNEAIWDNFREEQLPRFVQQFQTLLGTDHPIEIDWDSLGLERNNDQHLSYDLEMLHRTLSMDKRYEVPGYDLDAQRLRQGIERIRVRRVRQMEKRRLEVIDGTLEIDLFWGRLGSFTPDDIRILLADRKRAQLSSRLNAATTPLSPLMTETRHNRLPRLYRELERALGHPVPLHIDWEGLTAHPDAAYRLVYILDEVIKAISDLTRSENATVGMRRSPLAQQRADERRAIVTHRIQALRVLGGSYKSDPVLRFDDSTLELMVYLDRELDESPASAGAERLPLYQMERLSSCKKRALVNTLTDQLDLEVGPLLRQLQTVHFPRTQSYFRQYLDTLIGNTRFSAPERVALREHLTTKGITLEVDWDSFTTPGDREGKLRVMAMMEPERDTDNYGELFVNLFHALDEVARRDTQHLKVFFTQIEKIRFEQVSDPVDRELVRENSTLIIRQSLLHPGGVIPYDKLATKMILALGGMSDEQRPEEESAAALRDRAEIADIERSNRSFWTRMLRERFDRDIGVEVNWDAFLADAASSETPLYPLNIQQAGLERLLYALTGWMDDDEAFRAEAIERIDSLYVTSARGMQDKGITLKDGQITYRCYAGDWAGYYSIDEIQQQLGRLIPRKSRARKMLDGWMENLFTSPEKSTETHDAAMATTPQEQPPNDAYSEDMSEQTQVTPEPDIPPEAPVTAEVFDPVLRDELEAVYRRVIETIEQRDLDALLTQLSLSKSDEEILHKEMASDGFVSFSDWLLTVYPSLEKATLVSLKKPDNDFAGYYMVWVPAYSRDYLNLTLRTFIREGTQWKMRFQINDNSTAIFQVRKDEEALAKVQEVMATSPLLHLARPQGAEVAHEGLHPAPLSATERQIQKEFAALIQTHYRALESSNFQQFIAPLILSTEDKDRLIDKFKRHAKQLLAITPDPSASTFVKLQMIGDELAGYYFVAPYPLNPSFDFVYLKVFVKRDDKWRMLFNPDNELAMNLSAARSDGDRVSRALEVIHDTDLLQLEWVVSSYYDELIARGVDADGVSQNDRDLAMATEAIEREDYALALQLLPQLAEGGNAVAQSLLGLLYAEGHGVETDYTTSLALFERSAKQGEPDGLYYLGYSYLHGSGVDVDRPRALGYFILADQMGHKGATEEVNRAETALNKHELKRAEEIALQFRFEKPR